MKHLRFHTWSLGLVGLFSLVVGPLVAKADDAAVPAATVPPLAYGVSEIIQLSQAGVGDPTIVTFVKNSGNSYGLDASQIIYLRQQGVSETVVDAMLSQPAPGTLAPAAAPAPGVPQNTEIAVPAAADTVVSAPAPASSVYVIPDTATYRYYSTYNPYGGCPGYFPVAVSVGFGGHWGGGYHGGYHRTGWHR